MDRKWKVEFYRFVDSTDDPKIIKIEERIFKNVVEEVIKKKGKWYGSAEQNSFCDLRIASTLRSSFKNYESRRKEYEKSYFKF